MSIVEEDEIEKDEIEEDEIEEDEIEKDEIEKDEIEEEEHSSSSDDVGGLTWLKLLMLRRLSSRNTHTSSLFAIYVFNNKRTYVSKRL